MFTLHRKVIIPTLPAYNLRGDNMFELIKAVLENFLFFFLHLKSITSFPKPLSAEKEKELLTQMKKQGDTRAREKLIEHNLRLVSHIIKKYYSEYDEQEDLISIGTIGLIKGIDSFNTDKGIKLATYASKCIENEILMYFRSKKKDSNTVSVNEPIDTDSEGNPLTLIDIIYCEDTISDDIDLKRKSHTLYEYIEKIENERDREIIIRRYGLYNCKEQTQKEIAKDMNISRSYVSRIEKKVIEELREMFGIQ
ncbi:MAG: sigma-70 family RNA polymerase sigma factor [Ruminococcaceae bacterium]|nr:sigma-70 family RNA polymerase sigma factor [Oscillospiraceae bacterium]